MAETIVIPPNESGVVRVFAIELPPDDAAAFAEDPDALDRALGGGAIDHGHVDVFPVSRIAALGLPAYLSEGHGIAPGDLSADAGRLAAIDGHVAIVSSRAFGDNGRTLTVAAPLRLVGTYREEREPVTFGELPSAGAEGLLGGPKAPPPEAPRDGRHHVKILTVVILVVAVVGFILLNGGR